MKLEQRTKPDWRQQPILTQDQQYVFNRVVLAVLLITSGILIGNMLFGTDPKDKGYYTNLYTEVLSIGVTVGIIEYFSQRRARNEEEVRQKELVRLQKRTQQQQYEIRLRFAKNLEEKSMLLTEMNLLEILEGSDLSGMDFQGM